MGHSDAEIARMLDPRDKHFRTVVWQDADGRVVGSASAGPVDDPSGAWLTGLVRVAPEVQGRGIGTALVRAALEAARTEGASQVQCYIEPDNASSIRAHERAGYVRIGAERSFLMRASAAPPSPPADAAIEVEEVDVHALGGAVDSAGYGTMVRYFPGFSAASRPQGGRTVRDVARHLVERLRHVPPERRLVLRGGDRALVGLILLVQGEPRLMAERAQVPLLTVSRLAMLETAVGQSYWPRDQTKGFLLLHDHQSTPTPDLVLKTQRVYVA